MARLRQDSGDRLELLLFELGGSQRFGINVLKVKEIIPCPRLTHIPQARATVRGVAHLRGEPVTVIDLAQAIGYRGERINDDDGTIIITEFNRTMQGFLVHRVDRIVHCEWKEVLPPPAGTGLGSYITGITDVEKSLVQILDVEKVLGEMVTVDDGGGDDLGLDGAELEKLQGRRVLVVDDSLVARHQTTHTLEPLGITCLTARDGKEALSALQQMTDGNMVEMVISDIEMPEMDGYTLTREIRNDPRLNHLYVLLHTSLNGAINAEKAHAAGADDVLTKFVPVDLAHAAARGLIG